MWLRDAIQQINFRFLFKKKEKDLSGGKNEVKEKKPHTNSSHLPRASLYHGYFSGKSLYHHSIFSEI
jgi:hypothetical protein